MSSFRDKIAEALDFVREIRLRRTAGVPRGGPTGFCQEAVICKDRCLFKGIAIANKNAATNYWVFICDSPTACDKSTCAPLFVAASSSMSLDWTAAPRLMSQGIYVCISTDAATRTLPGAADAFFEVAFEPTR